MKNNRRILIRIVSHGLNALLKRHSLGIAFYHLGNISDLASFLLISGLIPSPPLLHLPHPPPPTTTPFQIPSLVSLHSLYILHQTLYQKMANYGWLVKSGLPPVSVNKVLEHNQAPSFSCRL